VTKVNRLANATYGEQKATGGISGKGQEKWYFLVEKAGKTVDEVCTLSRVKSSPYTYPVFPLDSATPKTN